MSISSILSSIQPASTPVAQVVTPVEAIKATIKIKVAVLSHIGDTRYAVLVTDENKNVDVIADATQLIPHLDELTDEQLHAVAAQVNDIYAAYERDVLQGLIAEQVSGQTAVEPAEDEDTDEDTDEDSDQDYKAPAYDADADFDVGEEDEAPATIQVIKVSHIPGKTDVFALVKALLDSGKSSETIKQVVSKLASKPTGEDFSALLKTFGLQG